VGIHIHINIIELCPKLLGTYLEFSKDYFVFLYMPELFLQLFDPSTLFFILTKKILEDLFHFHGERCNVPKAEPFVNLVYEMNYKYVL
jgi:hypothetical protein